MFLRSLWLLKSTQIITSVDKLVVLDLHELYLAVVEQFRGAGATCIDCNASLERARVTHLLLDIISSPDHLRYCTNLLVLK